MADNAMVKAEPTLPGLLPDRQTRDLIEELAPFYEGAWVVVSRKLTADERELLTRRKDDLARTLAPASADREDFKKLKLALSLWLGSYSNLANADAVGLTASYAAVLANVPVWAVQRAIRALADNDVTFTGRDGMPETPSPDFAVSAPRLRELAERYIHGMVVEQSGVMQLLSASRVARAINDDPEMAARTGAKLKDLAEAMRMKKPSRSLRGDESELELQAQRAKAAAEMHEREDARRRREWTALGIKVAPVVAGSVLSVDMATRLGWTVRKIDGMPTLVRPAAS